MQLKNILSFNGNNLLLILKLGHYFQLNLQINIPPPPHPQNIVIAVVKTN